MGNVKFQRSTHAYSAIQAVNGKKYIWTDKRVPAKAKITAKTNKLLLDTQGILIQNLPEIRKDMSDKNKTKAKQLLIDLCSEYGVVLNCSEIRENFDSLRRLK